MEQLPLRELLLQMHALRDPVTRLVSTVQESEGKANKRFWFCVAVAVILTFFFLIASILACVAAAKSAATLRACIPHHAGLTDMTLALAAVARVKDETAVLKQAAVVERKSATDALELSTTTRASALEDVRVHHAELLKTETTIADIRRMSLAETAKDRETRSTLEAERRAFESDKRATEETIQYERSTLARLQAELNMAARGFRAEMDLSEGLKKVSGRSL